MSTIAIEFGCRVDFRAVGDERLGLRRATRPQIGGDCLEPLQIAADEHEAGAARRPHARGRLCDCGCCAKNGDPLRRLGHSATLRQKSELSMGSFCAANASQRG